MFPSVFIQSLIFKKNLRALHRRFLVWWCELISVRQRISLMRYLIWNVSVSFYTEPYLQEKFKCPSSTVPCLVVRANLCPTADLVDALFDLEEDSVLEKDGEWIAYRIGTWSAEPRSDALIIHSY